MVSVLAGRGTFPRVTKQPKVMVADNVNKPSIFENYLARNLPKVIAMCGESNLLPLGNLAFPCFGLDWRHDIFN